MPSRKPSHAVGWKVANAPCSWGVIENIDGNRAVYARVLDEMQQAGYAGTELGEWGFLPTDPDRLTRELASRGLTLLASWVTVQLHDARRHRQNADDAVRTAGLLAAVGGTECLIVLGNDPYTDPVRSAHAGRVTAELAMTDEQWPVFADGANHVARRVMEETGLRTVFHHHIGSWIETAEETGRLLQMTDSAALGLCFDTGHWEFAGGDSVQGIRQHADRIWHVHFKDHDPRVAAQSRTHEWDGPTAVGRGVFCELGAGDVDFPAVLRTLDAVGYTGSIVVEQDVLPGTGTPKESARRNRDYLKSIGL